MNELRLFAGQRYQETIRWPSAAGELDAIYRAEVEITPDDEGLSGTAKLSNSDTLLFELYAQAIAPFYDVALTLVRNSGLRRVLRYAVAVMEPPTPIPISLCVPRGGARGFLLDFTCRLEPGDTLASTSAPQNIPGLLFSANVASDTQVRLVVGAMAAGDDRGVVTLTTQTEYGRQFIDTLRIADV